MNALSRAAIALLLSALLLGSTGARASGEQADPWEGFNRRVFAFNEFLDRNLLKPVAKGYQRITPEFVSNGVSNVFSNLGEVPSFRASTQHGVTSLEWTSPYPAFRFGRVRRAGGS